MANYITISDVDTAITQESRKALSNTSTTVVSTLIGFASSMVDMALKNGGYSVPVSGTAPDEVKVATIGALLPQLYGRQGLQVPDQFLTHMRMFEAIRNGEMPIPSLTPSSVDGTGGSKWSDPSDTATDGKPRVYKSLRDKF